MLMWKKDRGEIPPQQIDGGSAIKNVQLIPKRGAHLTKHTFRKKTRTWVAFTQLEQSRFSFCVQCRCENVKVWRFHSSNHNVGRKIIFPLRNNLRSRLLLLCPHDSGDISLSFEWMGVDLTCWYQTKKCKKSQTDFHGGHISTFIIPVTQFPGITSSVTWTGDDTFLAEQRTAARQVRFARRVGSGGTTHTTPAELFLSNAGFGFEDKFYFQRIGSTFPIWTDPHSRVTQDGSVAPQDQR